jgi:hypothetical protein
MRKYCFLCYCAVVVCSLAAFVAWLTIAFPTPSYVMAAGTDDKRSVAPRIAAWQERIAEEKLYEEKAARLAAIPEPPVPRTAQQTYGKQVATRQQQGRKALEAEAQMAKQRARQLAARRALEREAARFAQESAGFAYGYAPAPERQVYNRIYSTIRDDGRGGN